VPNPKPFVLKILISKLFENQILRDTVSRNPRGARLSGISKEKNQSGDLPPEANPSTMRKLRRKFISLNNPQPGGRVS
jgi:hypothetical protein